MNTVNTTDGERRHIRERGDLRRRAVCVVSWLSLALASACQPDMSHESAKGESVDAAASNGEIALTPEQRSKLGIETQAMTGATVAREVTGFGVVLGHDAIAQEVADVATAEAAVMQSQSALARVRGLANTPGAFSAETQENATRQAAADEAALLLARRKLSATFGQHPPWREDDAHTVLRELAGGQVKLVRATFPLGTLTGKHPQSLRFSEINPGNATTNWRSSTVWDAPADASIPGRSLFALLRDSDAGEGERLEVHAPIGAGEPGVVVPQSAVVIHDGAYWCYVETQPGTFVRKSVDTSRPFGDGYLVRTEIAPGESIVIVAAGLLLAREINPSTEAD